MIKASVPATPELFPEGTPGFEWVGGKISAPLTRMILSWMRHWHKQGETMGRLYYHTVTRMWGFEVFPQNTPRGLRITEVESDPRVEEIQSKWYSLGYTCLGTIHQHCAISAFQSSIDEADEKEWNGLHVTFGMFGTTQADVHMRYVHNKVTYTIHTPDMFFDNLDLSLSDEMPEYPKEWDERFVTPPPVVFSSNRRDWSSGYNMGWGGCHSFPDPYDDGDDYWKNDEGVWTNEGKKPIDVPPPLDERELAAVTMYCMLDYMDVVDWVTDFRETLMTFVDEYWKMYMRNFKLPSAYVKHEDFVIRYLRDFVEALYDSVCDNHAWDPTLLAGIQGFYIFNGLTMNRLGVTTEVGLDEYRALKEYLSSLDRVMRIPG
jgi:hypothetical protein